MLAHVFAVGVRQGFALQKCTLCFFTDLLFFTAPKKKDDKFLKITAYFNTFDGRGKCCSRARIITLYTKKLRAAGQLLPKW